jgi:hypothetical protein
MQNSNMHAKERRNTRGERVTPHWQAGSHAVDEHREEKRASLGRTREVKARRMANRQISKQRSTIQETG